MDKCPLCGSERTRLEHKSAGTSIRSCAACELLYRFPQPSDGELEELYNSHYTKEKMTNNRPGGASPENVLRQHLDLIDRFLLPLKGKRILDYGCGAGALGKIAKARGMDVAGVESNAHAREHLIKTGLFPVYKDAHELSASGKRFDLIVLIQVLEHLREPWNDIGKLAGLLSPGGCIYITTINSKGLNIIVNGFHRRELLKMEHLYWFTYKCLDALCKNAGLGRTIRLRNAVADTNQGPALRVSQTILGRFDLAGSIKIGVKR
ncbi:MAG: class I SAM-dependent methyltransferase [Candidatus Omnitrophota bacterium]